MHGLRAGIVPLAHDQGNCACRLAGRATACTPSLPTKWTLRACWRGWMPRWRRVWRCCSTGTSASTTPRVVCRRRPCWRCAHGIRCPSSSTMIGGWRRILARMAPTWASTTASCGRRGRPWALPRSSARPATTHWISHATPSTRVPATSRSGRFFRRPPNLRRAVHHWTWCTAAPHSACRGWPSAASRRTMGARWRRPGARPRCRRGWRGAR